MENKSATKITVSALINAPIEKVWKCFLDPTHIIKWNFASEDWHCPNAENEVKVGGKYKARMEAKDGSMGFDFEYTYVDVKEQESLSYVMTDGRKASTRFHENNSVVKIETTFEAETANPVDMQKHGWQMILNNFKFYVESYS